MTHMIKNSDFCEYISDFRGNKRDYGDNKTSLVIMNTIKVRQLWNVSATEHYSP